MSAENPANVPLSDDPRWRIAAVEPSSYSQHDYLRDLLNREDMTARDLYGEGYDCLPKLSRWAAHWGIDELEAIGLARCAREADAAAAEATENDLKAWIAGYYRARQRG